MFHVVLHKIYFSIYKTQKIYDILSFFYFYL